VSPALLPAQRNVAAKADGMSSADEAVDAPAGEVEAQEAEEEAQAVPVAEEAQAREAPAAGPVALAEKEPQAAAAKEKPPLTLTHVSALRPGTSGHNLVVKARASARLLRARAACPRGAPDANVRRAGCGGETAGKHPAP
jgi:hypothetical protein